MRQRELHIYMPNNENYNAIYSTIKLTLIV
jgi:hypothetical protein